MTLTEQLRHYAILRLFNGLETCLNHNLCLDAQVPVLAAQSANSDQLYEYSLTTLASYRSGDIYREQLLRFESHYDPGEILSLGPARWGPTTDTLAYQLIGQLVLWTQDKQVVTFKPLAATTGLKADRQRYYL